MSFLFKFDYKPKEVGIKNNRALLKALVSINQRNVKRKLVGIGAESVFCKMDAFILGGGLAKVVCCVARNTLKAICNRFRAHLSTYKTRAHFSSTF